MLVVLVAFSLLFFLNFKQINNHCSDWSKLNGKMHNCRHHKLLTSSTTTPQQTVQVKIVATCTLRSKKIIFLVLNFSWKYSIERHLFSGFNNKETIHNFNCLGTVLHCVELVSFWWDWYIPNRFQFATLTNGRTCGNWNWAREEQSNLYHLISE